MADWIRLGRQLRALRRERRWTQEQLAMKARCSRALVSRVERGGGQRLTGTSLERLAVELGAHLGVRIDWNGEALDRLLDRGHADLVEQVVEVLRRHGWLVTPEATFASGTERGSVDVLGWHASTRTLLVVEVKSTVPDVQATLMPLDRKVRLAPGIAASKGWAPAATGVLLVIGESRTARRRVERHVATFDARLPHRIARIREFIANPERQPHLRGLWFLPFATGTSARHRVSPRTRLV